MSHPRLDRAHRGARRSHRRAVTVAQVVKPNPPQTGALKRHREPPTQRRGIEHGPEVRVAEYEITVFLECRRLMVALQLGRESVGHRHGPG